MNSSQYKMLVLDLDGTLTNSKKVITNYTKQQILKAQKEQGTIVVLASGRPTYGIAPLAEELKLSEYGGYILSFNGGIIMNWKTKQIIHETVLKDHLIAPIYDMATKHGVNIISYIGEDIVTETPDNEYIRYEANLNRMPVRYIPKFTDEVKHNVPKCLIVGDADHLKKVEQIMIQHFGKEMSIYRSEPFFLEMMPLSIDKAHSLQILLDYLNINKNQMIACGDGYNDLSMIRLAGLGVAMANAVEPILKEADFVTSSNDEDGVGYVVDKFLLS